MFLRWKSRPLQGGNVMLRAALVVCERRDGAPRQRVIAYVGNIRKHDLRHTGCRLGFWGALERAVGTDDRPGTLGTFSPERRARFAAAVQKVVPYPTPREEAAYRKEQDRAIRKAQALHEARMASQTHDQE